LNIVLLVARICLALIFLNSSITKMFDFAATQDMMAGRGLPAPALLLLGNIVFQLVGATLLLLGYKVKWGAILLILFLVPTTLVFHNPFDPEQTTAFLKNLGLIGGVLYAYATGPGSLSLDEYLHPNKHRKTADEEDRVLK
jgi:uncharacterized membrane protein YphA (DoxX/SURF4 family)